MNNYLKKAIEIATFNPIKNFPQMGAVLVLRNGDVFTGMNQFKSHPMQAQWSRNPQSIFLHAEIDVLIKAIKIYEERNCGLEEIHDSSIYIARVLKNGQPALAKPCSGCLGALIHFGVDNIRWTE